MTSCFSQHTQHLFLCPSSDVTHTTIAPASATAIATMASSSHSMATPDTTGRSGRLSKFFRDTLSGKRTVVNSADAKLFFESAFGQESASVCVESIIASRQGLAAVKASVRADLSLAALQSQVLPFIKYLSHPSVKAMGEGQLLWKLLLAIAYPPTVWNALMDHHDELSEEHLYPLAWLAHELLAGRDDEFLDFVVDDVATLIKKGRLLQAESHDVRRLAYIIQKVISPQVSSGQPVASFSPGGRHDNDHANYRDIAIYPTTDEFLSTEKPFLRPAQAVFDADPDARAELHLDNQFRLMREDMLPEIRHDLQVALGKKARTRRAAQVLGGLLLEGIETGDEKFGKKCALSVICRSGLDELRRYEPRNDGTDERRNFLRENKNYLRHQSFGALLCGNEVCGFAVVDRDLDLLCRSPPVVCLQFSDSLALGKALTALQSASDSQFVLVDTPIFAYEPVLNALKAIQELPLQASLLNPSQSQAHNTIALSDELQALVSRYQSHGDGGLPISIKGKVVRLDRSQTDSFVNALSSPVSLIQGPPGKSYRLRHGIIQADSDERDGEILCGILDSQGTARELSNENLGDKLYQPCSRPVPRGSSRCRYPITRRCASRIEVHQTNQRFAVEECREASHREIFVGRH